MIFGHMDYDASVREVGYSMAKENPDTRPKAKTKTPFRRFEQLAKKLVRVPKDKVQGHKGQPHPTS
jgi:hypothetical protein